jgi:Rod binding domain-containing protein
MQSLSTATAGSDITVARAATLREQAEIRSASQEFESILIRQMLQRMRDSSINPYREETSNAYLALGDDQFAKIVSASGGFGFGQAMAEQLIWQINQAKQLSDKP